MMTMDEMLASLPVPDTLLERIKTQKADGCKLDLSLCNIIHLPLKAISENFGKPLSFDLSYNSIRYLSPEFVVDMVNLSRLDLSRNELRKLPENFGDMRKLIYLDLHHNKLETLPISMGKMTRLKFLSIADNPLRAPLCNLFGQGALGNEVSGVAVADLVIKLLAEMSVEVSAAGDTSQESFLRVRNSKVHYNEKSITGFESEAEEASSASHSSEEIDVDLDKENNLVLRQGQPKTRATKRKRQTAALERNELLLPNTSLTSASQRKPKSRSVWKIMKALFTLTCVLGILLPFILSVAIDTTFFDHWAQNPESKAFASFWEVYKPYHEMMETGFHFFFNFRPTPLRIRGPHPETGGDGFFTSCYNYVANMLSYIRSAFSFLI